MRSYQQELSFRYADASRYFKIEMQTGKFRVWVSHFALCEPSRYTYWDFDSYSEAETAILIEKLSA